MAISSRKLRWFLIPPAIVIALAVAAPFVLPVSSLIPPLIRIASEKLGQPVTIAGLKLHLLPTPRIVATGIVVGRKNDATLEELEIVPDLLSLIAGNRDLRLIRAQNIQLKESALAFPGAMPKAEAGTPVLVRRVVLHQVRLHHSTLQLPVFDLDARLGENFSVEHAQLEFPGSALQMQLVPQGERSAALSLEGRLYGGSVKASARADWTKGWQVSGTANLASVDVAPVQQLLRKKPQLTGRLKTNVTFSARAKSPDLLANAVALDGPFEVLGGAYQGVDLSKAGDLTGKAAPGDATTFQELKGKLQLRGKRTRISELCVRSPKLVAGGNIDIAPDQTLSGKLDVSVAKTGGFVGVPVSLTGTTSNPSVRPTKGYMIGAAVGTLLLPGIGTAMGSSLGSRSEGTSNCK